MSDQAPPAESNSPVKPLHLRALRVWPGVFLVLLMIVARFAPAYLEGGLAKYWMFAMMGPMLRCLLLLIWWLAYKMELSTAAPHRLEAARLSDDPRPERRTPPWIRNFLRRVT